ncbi:MAG: division/cell wall cluster transcriptional repressor MraZ [Chlamydiae bacterium]|nr:division/cell wall cluster transcriptional repressor MraZ [Chlamydiota bacterium]MBI3276893.1 division/cell wall cluster transcriptional repressor MraZ [Chlamydiota bacterium]
MFYGEYRHSLDHKNRVLIPSKFREAVKEVYVERFFLTRGLEKCIFVFTEPDWNLIEQKLKNLPMTQGNSRNFSRMFFSGAFEVVSDKQGRIIVPQPLLAYSGIHRDVVLVGVLNRIEIWDQSSWNHFVTESSKSYEEVAEKLFESSQGGNVI